MRKKDLMKLFIFLLFYIIITLTVFIILNKTLSNEKTSWISGDGWSTIAIGLLASASTIFLGYISFLQNEKQREDYKLEKNLNEKKQKEDKDEIYNSQRFQKMLEFYFNYNDKLNDINTYLNENSYILLIKKICTSIINNNPINLDKEIHYLIFLTNFVLYNIFYTDELDELCNKIIKLRIGLEEITNINQINNKEKQNHINNLMNLEIEFETAWINYRKSFSELIAEIIDKNDYYFLRKKIKDGLSKQTELRKNLFKN